MDASAAQSPATLRVQSVLYQTPLGSVRSALEYLDAAAANARDAGTVREVSVAYGDCSAEPSVDDAALEEWRSRFPNLGAIHYTHFGENLGHAGGQNRLLRDAAGGLVMLANPDVLVAPNLMAELVGALRADRIGLVEARELPIEQPKDYDAETGETSWASLACAIGPAEVFRELGGLDAETFFLTGGDVDYSWRARLAGYRIVHHSPAAACRDRRLNGAGGRIIGAGERYHAAEAALFLTYKYSREDLTEQYLSEFSSAEDLTYRRAAAAFRKRRQSGRLPAQIDEGHAVAEFVDGGYGRPRFKCR